MGTYVCSFFDEKTVKSIQKYLSENNIPNGLRPHKLHTTVLYSKKRCPDYITLGPYEKPIIGITQKLVIWKLLEDNANCLVLLYDCPQLISRHLELMEEHQATFEFSRYQPHITLSYDCGDLDITTLPDIREYVPRIVIVNEYGEELLGCDKHS